MNLDNRAPRVAPPSRHLAGRRCFVRVPGQATRRWWTHTVLAVALAAVCGCGGEQEGPDRQVGPSSASDGFHARTQAANEPAAVLPLERASLPVDDPRQQGWEIEAFTSVVTERLKHLDELLSEDAGAAASELAAASFHAPVIRSEDLDEVFDDGWMIVRRLAAHDAPISGDVDEEAAEGPKRLLALLRAPLDSLDGLADLRTKTKVFRVELEGDQARTGIYYQLDAQGGSGRLQVNAAWNCAWTEATSSHPRLQRLEITDYEEVRTSTGNKPLFSDCTNSVLDGPVFRGQLRHGVDHWLSRIESRLGIDVGGWQGLAIGDVNGDELPDIYLAQPGGLPNRLYVQNPDGTASEHSAAAGVDWIDSSHAALFLDLDNDGDQDLLVGVESGILVMSNDGTGRFTTRAAQVLPAAAPYSMAAADYDVDGDLDVYVCCYNRRQGVNRHLLFARPVPYHDANNGGRNVLLRNDACPPSGNWRFSHATTDAGLDENNRRFSYAAAWEDHDDDGDMDLYVANDFGRNNLYLNEGGRFRDAAAAAGVEDIGPGMSACWGDYNNDGRMDLYVANMFSSAGNRITYQNQFQPSADDGARQAFRRHARGNSLFANRGDGSFDDVSLAAGVVLGRWAWGSKFADLNNDGWEDLVVANGFITQEQPDDL